MGKLKRKGGMTSAPNSGRRLPLPRLKDYIHWQRRCDLDRPDRGLPNFSPTSINMDLTSACNFSCPFCVDSKLTNAGKKLDVRASKTDGRHTSFPMVFLSVILIGRVGKPTLHNDFGEIVRYIKARSYRLGLWNQRFKDLKKLRAIVDALKRKRLDQDFSRCRRGRSLPRLALANPESLLSGILEKRQEK